MDATLLRSSQASAKRDLKAQPSIAVRSQTRAVLILVVVYNPKAMWIAGFFPFGEVTIYGGDISNSPVSAS